MSVEYSPAELTANFLRIGDAQRNFLRDFLFARVVTHASEYIDFGVYTGTVRSYPVVGPNAPAILVEHGAGELKTFKPGRLRVKIAIDENFVITPMPGIEGFNARYTRPEDQRMAKISAEQLKVAASFALTEEDWCAQVLADGAVVLCDENDATRYTLDFGYLTTPADAATIQTALTGADAWDEDTSDPIGDLDTLEEQIRSHSQFSGQLVVVLGTNASASLRNHAKVQKILDLRRYEFGRLQPAAANNYVGTLGNFDLYKYTRKAIQTTRGSTLANLWDPDTIAMVPVGSDAIAVHYGGIFDRYGDSADSPMQMIQTTRYSKTYRNEDPPSDMLVMESRPAPAILDPNIVRILKVQ